MYYFRLFYQRSRYHENNPNKTHLSVPLISYYCSRSTRKFFNLINQMTISSSPRYFYEYPQDESTY